MFCLGKSRKRKEPLLFGRNDYEILDLTELRQIFGKEFKNIVIPFEWDLKRFIDDFVFLTFFVGNDFLPALPHLDIGRGSLLDILHIYYTLLPSLGGYITNKSSIHPQRLATIIQAITLSEGKFFSTTRIIDNLAISSSENKTNKNPINNKAINTPKEAKKTPNSKLNYKNDYYTQKFGFSANDNKLNDVVRSYIEGLYWVLHYYHHGCGSWAWHYPFHYAPLGTDLHTWSGNVSLLEGKPVSPFVQLLSVVPPQCSSLLPATYQNLIGESSPISDFYPKEFVVDPNGKVNSWEYIIRIPFIDASRLFAAVKTPSDTLTMKEQLRNITGRNHLFVPHRRVNPGPKISK